VARCSFNLLLLVRSSISPVLEGEKNMSEPELKFLFMVVSVVIIVCGVILKWFFLKQVGTIRASFEKPLGNIERYLLDALEQKHKRIVASFQLFGIMGVLASFSEKWPWSLLLAPAVVFFMLTFTKRR
jgi:hypothetical protein